MDSDIQQRVIEFVADDRGWNPSKIGLETTLLGDMGMDGDDAVEFFLSFANTFKVDLNEFCFSNYFDGEGASLFELPQSIWRLIKYWREDPHVIANKQAVTVKDLIEAAEKKKWTPKVTANAR